MNTEIKILKSKSVALRVVKELGLDTDPEFQSHGLRIWDLVERIWRNRIVDLAKRLGFSGLGRVSNNSAETIGGPEERPNSWTGRQIRCLRDWIFIKNHVITVSTASRDPIKAQRLASTIANDYLSSQREARQEALEHVATWLKGRVDDLQSRVLETESSIEKLKVESGVHDDTEIDKSRSSRLAVSISSSRPPAMRSTTNVPASNRRVSLIETNGGIDSIPELTASATLSELRRKQMELNWSAAELQNKLGERKAQVISIRAQLATVNKQIDAEAGHILGNMKNAYDIAVRREQSLEANLQSLTAKLDSETSIKLQELRRVADADRKVYESYLSQYNDIAERRELQDASARIISPATLPRSPGRVALSSMRLAGWRVWSAVYCSPSCWNISDPGSRLGRRSSNPSAYRSWGIFL